MNIRLRTASWVVGAAIVAAVWTLGPWDARIHPHDSPPGDSREAPQSRTTPLEARWAPATMAGGALAESASAPIDAAGNPPRKPADPEDAVAIASLALASISREWADEADRVREAMWREGRYREYLEGDTPPEIADSILENGVEKIRFSSQVVTEGTGARRILVFYISRDEHPRYWTFRDELERVRQFKQSLLEAEPGQPVVWSKDPNDR